MTNFKQPRIRSKGHLRFIRSLICCNCGISKPIEAAHIRSFSQSGTGLKPSDDKVCPLCTMCHFKQHNGAGERAFWGDRLYAAMTLAENLYKNTGDTHKCLELIRNFRIGFSL